MTSKWEVGANEEQLAVIRHVSGPLRVNAQAGSGKTFALTRRLAALVSLGVEPARILAVTFSKKAQMEMAERVERLGIEGVQVQTWHAFALRVLREDGARCAPPNRQIDEKDKEKTVVKKILGYQHLKWDGADLTKVRRFIGTCKANLFDWDSEEARLLAREMFGTYRAELAVQAFKLRDEHMADAGLVTFDDLLVECNRHFLDEFNRRQWAARFDHVLTDEAQDDSRAQKAMAHAIARDHRNLMVVGDVAQCHPAGVLVDVGNGQVPIEELVDGDVVRGWNRNAQKMVGGRSIKVGRRYFSGVLYDMRAADRSVEMTPNHRLLARWTDRETEVCATYLMWREDLGFRVGWCKMFASSGNARYFHFAQRCRLEKAERAWILGVHESRTDASVQESVLAAKYGIPTATFEPVHGAQHLTRESLDRIFGETRTTCRAMQVLTEFNRHFEFPMYPWPGKARDEVGRVGRKTYFEVYACNLIPGLMSIPLPDATNAWTPVVDVVTRAYDGDVYSLDVEEDHSYAANGLVVLNSIYGFRGSKPEFLAGFHEEWEGTTDVTMNRNYRSNRKIVALANAVIRPATIRVQSDMVAAREDATDGEATLVAATDHDDEAAEFVGWVRANHEAGRAYSDMTCLFRTNAQSRALEDQLLKAQVPYLIVGGVNFWQRKEVKDLLSYLRVAAGRDAEGDGVRRCINAPFRFLGARYVERLMDRAAREGRSDWAVLVQDVAHECDDRGKRLAQGRQVDSALEWSRMMREVAEQVDQDAKPSDVLEMLVRRTGYIAWLEKEEGEESIESSHAANVREMLRVAASFATVGELLDYIDKNVKETARAKKATGDRVLLMSIHRSKGLEWPLVWVLGCNEMVLPHAKGDIDEERRLAYVAVTRAREEVVCSYVTELTTRAGVKPGLLSRFFKGDEAIAVLKCRGTRKAMASEDAIFGVSPEPERLDKLAAELSTDNCKVTFSDEYKKAAAQEDGGLDTAIE